GFGKRRDGGLVDRGGFRLERGLDVQVSLQCGNTWSRSGKLPVCGLPSRNEDDAPQRAALPASALSVLVRRVSLNPPDCQRVPVRGDEYNVKYQACVPSAALSRAASRLSSVEEMIWRCSGVKAWMRAGSISGN